MGRSLRLGRGGKSLRAKRMARVQRLYLANVAGMTVDQWQSIEDAYFRRGES